MIYTARGTRSVDQWVDRYLEDRETSAIEGHIGTWQEEVARIVGGGTKPGSGVDLQRTKPDAADTEELYAIQSAPNTKNAGARASDVDGLRKAARAIRASRRHVDMNIAVLSGRKRTTAYGPDPSITVLASDEFWDRISQVEGFRSHLIEATTILAPLVRERAADEVERIRAEARQIFGDDEGNLRIDVLADPPPRVRRRR